jgi:ADP-ribose pyrophosphatase YjhB (NUDIX family)
MFPGGRKRQNENAKDCLRREIKEELPNLKLGRLRLWKEVKSKNQHSGRRMSDAILIAKKASGFQLETPLLCLSAAKDSTFQPARRLGCVRSKQSSAIFDVPSCS